VVIGGSGVRIKDEQRTERTILFLKISGCCIDENRKKCGTFFESFNAFIIKAEEKNSGKHLLSLQIHYLISYIKHKLFLYKSLIIYHLHEKR